MMWVHLTLASAQDWPAFRQSLVEIAPMLDACPAARRQWEWVSARSLHAEALPTPQQRTLLTEGQLARWMLGCVRPEGYDPSEEASAREQRGLSASAATWRALASAPPGPCEELVSEPETGASPAIAAMRLPRRCPTGYTKRGYRLVLTGSSRWARGNMGTDGALRSALEECLVAGDPRHFDLVELEYWGAWIVGRPAPAGDTWNGARQVEQCVLGAFGTHAEMKAPLAARVSADATQIEIVSYGWAF